MLELAYLCYFEIAVQRYEKAISIMKKNLGLFNNLSATYYRKYAGIRLINVPTDFMKSLIFNYSLCIAFRIVFRGSLNFMSLCLMPA